MPIVDLSGYWNALFGIDNEAEFVALVAPSMPSVNIPLIGANREDLAKYAWNNPLSWAGSLATGILSLQGLRGGEDIPPSAYGAGLTPYVQTQAGAAMPTLVIANAYQVVVQGECNGREIFNVIGLIGTGPGQEAAAATAAQVAWETTGGPLTELTFRYVVNAYQATDLSSTSGGIAVVTSGTTGGKTATDVSARGASALVKWNGGSRDRTTRGRLYFGPLSEDQVQSDGATLETTAVTAIGTAFGTFRGALHGAGFDLGVISRKDSKITLVASQVVESMMATQRRRVRG